MPTVYRVSATWSGFQGAPGTSKFSFTDLIDNTSRNAAGTILKQYFEGIKAYLQTGWTIAVNANIEEFDVVTGVLTGANVMGTPPTITTGTAVAAPYAGGSGACSTWRTSAIFNGRRVRGRTFLVPLAATAFGTDGTLDAACLSALTTAGSALVGSSPQMAVWAKVWSTPTTPDEKPVQIGGTLADATACTVKDMASQLRSRRL